MENDALANLQHAVLDGEEELAAEASRAALGQGIAPGAILGGISEAADELGRRFQSGECYLPELFAGAEAMSAAVDLVLPELQRGSSALKGTIVIGTVEGDIHEIGKRIVAAMLAGAGFRVHDIGIDVKAATFVDRVRELRPDIVAASAYITTTSQRLPDIDAALREAGLRSQVKYLIGGASVNRGMVPWAGADGYGENAGEAITAARELIMRLRSERP